jgi:hypothetical protein
MFKKFRFDIFQGKSSFKFVRKVKISFSTDKMSLIKGEEFTPLIEVKHV